MGNMSYCRFENTYSDLGDCADHIDDTGLSDSEHRYRKRLIQNCIDIIITARNCGFVEDMEMCEEFFDKFNKGDEEDECSECGSIGSQACAPNCSKQRKADEEDDG